MWNFDLSVNDLRSKVRTKEVAYARQISMYLARQLTTMSLPKIGESFGNRDHSTVIHACDKISSRIKEDNETKNVVNILLTNIKSSG